MRPSLLLSCLLALGCVQRVAPPAGSPSPVASPLASPRPAVAVPGRLPSLDSLRESLLPALYPPDVAAGLTVREDLPGVSTALVAPAMGTVSGIPAGAPSAWGKPVESLFGLALQNLAARPLDFKPLALRNGVVLQAAQGEEPFVASHVLQLSRYPSCVGPYGALVAVPTRHYLLCYPIRDEGVTLAVQFLPVVARRLHAAGPGPVTDKVYLYRDGRFVDVPYRLDKGGFALSPPREFLEILRELGKRD